MNEYNETMRKSLYQTLKYQESFNADMPSDYIVFDTETTGTSSSSKIIEIGAIKYRNHEMIDEFQCFIDPMIHIPSFITNLTGITNQDVADAPLFHEVYEHFLTFIEDLPLVAHNAAFDIGMMDAECTAANLPSLTNPVIDTVTLARRVIPKSVCGNHQLSTLKEFFGLVAISHRAVADCEVCATVYQYYCANRSTF
ncbi:MULTISPECIES: exonuclease domain-containing protein [unclassified Breznakia]|uniref:3'-5' exonuclease n=1 Tax=unclassified Breznakia TaxID=2623764 RepID=UPI002473D302|nr:MULTISPECIES: exonuclease domain-containing protein [unclassified Breznakia]MDH6367725.1 DNA polymerase III epsilon subunit family exonuclease [Breznakia sp. PH1-1]MDH6404813.1 DNA polymerase III epsilon subunit family exonuclease [Breznakia sp. PF1-11]MDH6412561.1 DNA polymerase III epsilon subunit family exonuclease [Breznakia sp. PFB1-11]MDH6414888.1 DNA polymerase III epsilon subunit family exonuclease [Breznakia sp. PFB1-14]MDH6417232.1 DNA polymerase III epsilon subunit family exonucl